MWWRLAVFSGVVAAAVVVAVTTDVPSATELRGLIAAAGWAAPVTFIGLYALVTLAPVPKNVLSALGGLLFGVAQGVVLVLVAALLGALVAFGLGRLLGRSAVERLTSARVRDVDDLIARRGLLAVVVVRLIPVIPFTAINYTAGLTAVRLRDYTLGTALGMMPGTVAYVTLGTYGATPGSLPFVVAALALLGLTIGGLVVARRRRSSGEEQVA